MTTDVLLSRRLLLAGSLAAALTGALSACNSSVSAEQTDEQSEPAQSVFPVTVKHKYGETIVPAEPQRVVVVGFTEQDILLALGVTPVATTEWYGEQPYAVWPWATPKLSEAKPEVIKAPDKLPMEQIAALTPDLIIGTNAGLTKEVYASLTKIAPTIANSGEYDSDWFEPWPTQTVMVGKALGKEAEAQRLVDDLTKRFADTAAGHPQFAEVPAIFLQAPFYEGHAIAYQDGLGTEFLTDLGFVIPKELDAYEREGEQAYIPVENLDVLNAGKVLIWATEDDAAKAELEKNKLFTELEAVRAGRSLYTGGVLAGAIYFSTVLSLPYVLDTLVPELEKAVPA
ncbi:MAG TPA: iron-siderophore ABC transporter substrate-binding protein [Microlunatus sp.]|jgi:iron complex transport system substrate-binding protein|nr:iron-siderophore ABC transporter substrate-binding protein [Microlunatus sp.]